MQQAPSQPMQPATHFVAPQQMVQTVVPQQGQQPTFLNPAADNLFFNSSYMLIRQREEPLNFIGIDQANAVLFRNYFLYLFVTFNFLSLIFRLEMENKEWLWKTVIF